MLCIVVNQVVCLCYIIIFYYILLEFGNIFHYKYEKINIVINL